MTLCGDSHSQRTTLILELFAERAYTEFIQVGFGFTAWCNRLIQTLKRPIPLSIINVKISVDHHIL